MTQPEISNLVREQILWLLYPEKGDVAFRIMHRPLADAIIAVLAQAIEQHLVLPEKEKGLPSNRGYSMAQVDAYNQALTQCHQVIDKLVEELKK